MRAVVLRSLRLIACSGFSTTVKGLSKPIIRKKSRVFSSYKAVSPNVAFDSADTGGDSETSQQANEDDLTHNDEFPFFSESLLPEPRTLVVGDGDLSYSASIAAQASESCGSLVATVLDSEEAHAEIYRNSKQHFTTISSHPSHQVLFQVDATKLHEKFPPDYFNLCQFNFPHWLGKKSNNRYNRILLGDFLASASQVLKRDGGEIQVALRNEQGGARAKDIIDWRLSWKASELATEAGLLLSRLEAFEPTYDVSSYRGGDKKFNLGTNPERYIFTFPNGSPIERNLQLCYRHELRIVLETECLDASPHTKDALLNDDSIVLAIARDVAPEGVHVEIPIRTTIAPTPGKNTAHCPLLVFLLVYGGESIPLKRMEADGIRDRLEHAIRTRLGFPLAKPDRLVSKPFPYSILDKLIRDYK